MIEDSLKNTQKGFSVFTSLLNNTRRFISCFVHSSISKREWVRAWETVNYKGTKYKKGQIRSKTIYTIIKICNTTIDITQKPRKCMNNKYYATRKAAGQIKW